MTSAEQPDLLFFDTFSHDTSEELNLDLVQFPKSVYVREIRIIPLGARVEGDFPGGVRLGATNPTKFHIDFFVNDLSKPGASTFEALGSLDYCQNGQIHMECSNVTEEPRIPTDGLVLRGWYTTITLAVYGDLTQVINDSPPISANPPQTTLQRQSLPREAAPAPEAVPPPDWNPEATNPIPSYTGNVAASNPDAYGPNYPENYDPQMYRQEYYESEGPKDPRTYIGEPEWEKDPRMSPEREERRLSPRSIEHDRDRDRRSRRRTRSRSRRRDRSRDLDRGDLLRSRSRSRDRDYIVKGEYRDRGVLSRSRSRSPEAGRSRGLSNEREWDRASYKKDDYRRRREDSYERSRGGSYDKRSGSFERRSPYEKRTPSYERKLSYEKRGVSPYDKRASSYERRAPSYDKKRHSPYRRLRGSSYGSRSPSRDDPRKRPRTPPGETSRRPLSPRDTKSPIRSEDGAEFDRSGKQIPRVEFYHQSYRHKSSIRSPSQEVEAPAFIEPQHSSLVTVPIIDTNIKPTIESPVHNQEDEKSMDAEQFEPILSDEDICDDAGSPAYTDMDYDASEYCIADDIIKYFNPFKTEWVKYENVNKIHLLATVNRPGIGDVVTASFDELCDVNTDLLKISELTKLAKGREQKFYASTFQDIDNPSREEWVHQAEQIAASLTSLCKNTDIILRIFQNHSRRAETDEFTDIFNLLITFCKIGLSFDYALAQQQPTYKIRHMKCGIRLAEALMAHKHNGIVMTMLLKSGVDVPMMLLDMYAKEYMALSIRLMILKSLDACLSSKESIDHFMHDANYPKFDKNETEGNRPRNGYQALIAIMQTNPLARIKFSISALIKKLNMYELLGKLYKIVLSFNQKGAESSPTEEVELTESNIEFIVDALGELLHTSRSQAFHMSQPRRFLPVSAQFDINKDCSNETLLEFFYIHHLLEVCLYLLTCPTTCNNLVVVSPIHDLIYELIHSHNGINFLYNNMDMSELLFKSLVQPYGQNTEDFIYTHDLSNYSDLQILGLELAYRLKCLYYLYSITDLQAGKQDDNELIDRLQSLYCLSFGSIGKSAVPDIIVMGDNAECLMEVFEKTPKAKTKNESPSKQKSPAKGYAIELIAAAIRFSSNVPFLKKYGHRLLNVAKVHDKFEPSVSSVLQEIVPYLKPIEKSSLISGDDMAECIEILKRNSEHAPDLPGELMTCLRVLRHFCISDYDTNVSIESESATEEYVELKYKYNVLQLFSLDGVAHLSGILDRLTVHFDQPSMHTAFFASVKGLQLAQMLLPCLRLLDEMLARVVRCRGSKFRDLTAAPILLKTYGVAKAFPVGSVGYRTAAKAAEAAVRALLAYSQPIADDATDNDSIRRGPWTSLCSEVISYTMTAPYTFVPGLLVFSELLPLPLPMQTKILPTEQELSDALNERRLWSGHLHALSNDLTDMIQVICMSTYRPVVHMLRRVCVQIADLAPNTAATVAKAAVGAVVRELKLGEPASGSTARVLSFLACLVAHAPVKCAVLHGMNCGAPKSAELHTALCCVLSLGNSSSDHAAAQEYAAHVLAGLCDVEVTLTPMTASPDTVIANSLPNKESLTLLLESTADCLESATKTFTVATSVLRAYFVLTEYEYGFQQLRKIVTRRRESFGKFFKWTLEGPEEDKAECLSLYIDLIRILKVEEVDGPLGRKSTLTPHEVGDMVGFSAGDTEHPVLSLEKTLKDRNVDEDAVSNAAFLASHLSALSPPDPPASPPVEEVLHPSPLVAQFSSRTVHAAGDAADERLTASYWLNVPAASLSEDDANDHELVPCDIMSLATSLLGAAGGAGALAGGVRRLAGAGAGAPDAPPAGERPPAALCLSVRGLGGLGGVGGLGGGSGDAFRSRPPNTSRPPSLHVDDFTRALHHDHHDYSHANNNRGSRRGIAVADRGRFASATPHPAHYRALRGRGAWELGAQHFAHFPPSPYMMGGMGWGGGRMQRGPRHRNFMR